MKKLIYMITIVVALLIASGCTETGQLQNAGMLVETSVHDKAWDKKGYEGLMAIEEEFNRDVYYKEGIKTEQDVREAVDDLVDKGVNLIYGHSSSYGNHFESVSTSYPDVHFVYFNGGEFAEDVTSLNFNAHAMGFFAGMAAGKMTESDQVGVIGAFEWQPEIEGYFEGVKYQNPDAEVQFNYVNDWHNQEIAMDMYTEMKNQNMDVIYPAGNAYSEPVIKQASADGLYAIGYVSNQLDIAEETVLTSTVQHVDKLYMQTAELFNKGDLRGGVLTYDFQDDVISLGDFSPEVPEEFQELMRKEVESYKDTGLLPNERESE